MLQPFNRAGAIEPSRKGRHLQAHMRSLKWLIAILVLALLAIGGSTTVLAAKTSLSSTVPTLKVTPKDVGIPGDGINCQGILPNGTSVCHVTLNETRSSSKPLHWVTRSDFPAKFSPASGNLSPGQSIKVTITTKFCGGSTNFYFVGPHNVATVTFHCG